MKNYSMSEAAAYISVPKVGRTILYRILRTTEVVDAQNRPNQKFIDKDLIRAGINRSTYNGTRQCVTYVVGTRGLEWVKILVKDYLADNPIPRVKYFIRKRIITTL
jgi:hypothetical protein